VGIQDGIVSGNAVLREQANDPGASSSNSEQLAGATSCPNF
jgi:hypothetical protein